MLEIQPIGSPCAHVSTRRGLSLTLLVTSLSLATMGAQTPAGPKKSQQTSPSGTTRVLQRTPLVPENSWFFISTPLQNGKLPQLFHQLPGKLDLLASSWRTWARKAAGASPERWTWIEVSLLHGSEGNYPQGTVLISLLEPGSPSVESNPGIETTKILPIPSPFEGRANWAMAQRKGRIWLSDQPKAIQEALRIQAGEAGNLYQDESLKPLWKEADRNPQKITLILRPLGVRKFLFQAPLGAALRSLLKSPLGKSSIIALHKDLQSPSEDWTFLGSPQNTNPLQDPATKATETPHNIPQIEGRAWLWTASSWEKWLAELPTFGKTPAPLALLPILAETIKGSLGDQEKQEWTASLGKGILWLGPLPEQKGGGVLIPITDPQAIQKALRAAGAKDYKNPNGGKNSSLAQLLWEGAPGKLQIDIQQNHILLATPGFDLGELDPVGNTQDLPGNTIFAGALSGRELGVPSIPNLIEFQAQRTQQSATKIALKNSEGSLLFWGSLGRALGTKTATATPSLANNEDPALLEAILSTLKLETDPARAKPAINEAKKSKDLETLRNYALSEKPQIAAWALEALGTLKDATSAPLFEKGLAENTPAPIRWASAYALSRLGTPKARTLLKGFFMDGDSHVRLYALKAQSPKDLSKKNQDDLVQLIDTWTKDETADRSQALLLLHDQGDPSSLSHLALTPAGGNRFQQALVYTFQDLSPKLPTREEVAILRKAMRSRNLALQRYAIQRLGALGTQEAVATLREESKRLAGTPLAPAIRTSLEANSAGPGIGALLSDAKSKVQFWFRASMSWLRRQDPLTQKALALSPIALLLLFAVFWGLHRRKRRRLAQEGIQKLIQPSQVQEEEELSSYPQSEDMVNLGDEEEAYAGSLYEGKE